MKKIELATLSLLFAISCTKGGGSKKSPGPSDQVPLDLLPEVSYASQDACEKSFSSTEMKAMGYSNECLVKDGGSFTKEETMKLISSRSLLLNFSTQEQLEAKIVKVGQINFNNDGSYSLNFISLGGKMVMTYEENNESLPVADLEVNKGKYKVLESGEIEMSYPTISTCSLKTKNEGSIIINPHLFRKKDRVILVGFKVEELMAPLFSEKGNSVFALAPYGKNNMLTNLGTSFTIGEKVTINENKYSAMFGCFYDRMGTFQEERR